LRAGLLSEPDVIHRINSEFVSTWILKEDMKSLTQQGDRLAQELAANFEHPLDLMFLTSEGRLVSRLNSFQDFPGTHPDVTTPPFTRRKEQEKRPHAEVFFSHLARHFPRNWADGEPD
jgi:hypothetical protein